MNDITLKIKGTQSTQDGGNDEIEIVTIGKQYKKNDCNFIVYDETELSGMENCTTTLKVEQDKITMKRFGSNESKLTFENKVNHKAIYKTIYGNMDMEIYTEKIDVVTNEVGIKNLYISYALNIEGNIESKNTLSITVNH